MRVKCLAQEHNSTRPLPGLENIVLCCLRIVNTQVNSERKTPSNFLIMICNFESKERQYKICKMHVLLFGKYFFTSSWFRAILRSVLQISYISFKNVARNLVQKTIASRPKPLSPFCPRCFFFYSAPQLTRHLERPLDLVCVFFLEQKTRSPGSRKLRFHGKRLTGQLARDLPLLALKIWLIIAVMQTT